MRRIRRSTQFRRDYKRESKGRHGPTLDEDFAAVLEALVADEPLAVRFQDHALGGAWKGYRDCHVKPDLVLIYAKPDPDTLDRDRLGSHSEVFR